MKNKEFMEWKVRNEWGRAFLNMCVLVVAWPVYFLYVGCFLQEGNGKRSWGLALEEMEYY